MTREPDDQEPMGLRVEQLTDVLGEARVERWPALLLPLDGSVIELAFGDTSPLRVDATSFALLPASARYRLTLVSPMARLVTLLVKPVVRERAGAEYQGHIEAARFHDWLGSPRTLPRTRWVDELAQRYVFERDVCEKHGSMAAVFLETELAKEVYFLCKERDEQQTRVSVVHEEGDVAPRARAWIERHLFEPLRVSELVRHCHTSESTLLRAFQREFNATPATYARNRRLDAALLLLKSCKYTVGQVAARVGYKGLPSFTVAFQRRFGSLPSQARNGEKGLEVLPAHGQPPRQGVASPRTSAK